MNVKYMILDSSAPRSNLTSQKHNIKEKSVGGISIVNVVSFVVVLLVLFAIGLLGFLLNTTLFLPDTMASTDLVNVSSGNALFANKFYGAVSKTGGNVFFSPISAHAVLSMAYQGAAGVTAKAFASTLNVPNQKVAANGYKQIMGTLNSVENVTLHMANKVFVMKDFPLKSAFKSAITDSFLSEVDSVNFADNHKTATEINRWVENKTNNKIKDLIMPEALDALTRLVLVNAVYFKGDWREPFTKELTETEPFYVSNDEKVDCQMMHNTARYRYAQDDALDAAILELPYSNPNISMVVILPNERDGIANLEKKLANVDLSTITQKLRSVEVQLALPKFKVETEMDLQGVLTELGLGNMFDQTQADFSQISDSPEQLYVSKVIQKAFIEVNEEGAEAAAATAIVMRAQCLPIVYDFRADHQFIILLQMKSENYTDILFYGKIETPTYFE